MLILQFSTCTSGVDVGLRCSSALKDVSPPPLNLKDVVEKEALSVEPVLIMISPGSDPSDELEEVARSSIGIDKYHQVRLELTEIILRT